MATLQLGQMWPAFLFVLFGPEYVLLESNVWKFSLRTRC